MKSPRRMSAVLTAIAGLTLSACGDDLNDSPSTRESLSAFADFTLRTNVSEYATSGTPDPDNYLAILTLRPASTGDSAPASCRAPYGVTATLDGQEMTHARDTGGCDYVSFVQVVPRSRFGEAGGTASFVLRDATYTMTAEFENFYGPPARAEENVLPVAKCEGVSTCIGGGLVARP